MGTNDTESEQFGIHMAPNGDNLRDALNALTADEYTYVVQRSYAMSDAEAYNATGWSRSTFYRIETEHREHMNALAAQLKRNRSEEALRIIDESVAEAARTVAEIMTSGKAESTRLKAATEILDRGIGKPTNRHDVTQHGDNVLRFEFVDTTDED